VVDASGDVAVDSVLGALSGLTILPASDPSIASYGWIAGRRVPPASTPSRLRGSHPAISASFSVASGLTEVPSFHSAPALGVQGGILGGEGGGMLRLTRMPLMTEDTLPIDKGSDNKRTTAE
jgi:hypothetical protein